MCNEGNTVMIKSLEYVGLCDTICESGLIRKGKAFPNKSWRFRGGCDAGLSSLF
jgi:hypothetical protein